MKMVDGSTVRHGRADCRVTGRVAVEGWRGDEGEGCTVMGRDGAGWHTQEQVEVKEVRERGGGKEERSRWREDGVNLSSRVQRREGGKRGRREGEKKRA